jgi:hypothetical protein
LQQITEKYRNSGLIVLAINTDPKQDAMVVAFLAGSGYTFTAVKDTDEAIQKAYNVNIAPTNILIDTEGRMVARPVLGNAEQERWLGAWIELLLNRR